MSNPMNRHSLAATLFAAALPTIAWTADMPTPPIAETRPHAVTAPSGASMLSLRRATIG